MTKHKRRNRGNSFSNKQHKSITTFEIIQKMILQRRLQCFHRSPWMFANSALTYLSPYSASSYLITALFRLSFSSFNLVILSWAARLIPFNSSIFSSIASSVIVYIQSLSFSKPIPHFDLPCFAIGLSVDGKSLFCDPAPFSHVDTEMPLPCAL